MGEPAPRRIPLACGALGRFDRRHVLAMATAMAPEMRPVVDEEGALLFTDRPPRTWAASGNRGWSWGRALPPPGPEPATWQAVAERGDLGLVIGVGGPRIHSTTSGSMPFYWRAEQGAIYFCTRIDPLVVNVPGALTVDWESWASILIFGCPNGPHTPFAEVHRLPPQSVATMEGERAVERSEDWPWLSVEPSLSVERGVGAVLEALRAVVARLPDEPTPVCLSGGLDSRVLVGLMAERDLDVTAYTVNADSGNDREEQGAAAVASALGLTHRTLTGRVEDFWPEGFERALRADFQRNANPWLSPAHRAVAEQANGVVLDGLGGENILDGGSYLTPAVMQSEPSGLAGAVWRAMRKERAPALAGELGAFCEQHSRRRLRAVARRLADHPNRGLLMTFWLRSMNGISHVAYGNLGAQANVEGPFVSTEVATPALRVRLADKRNHSLRLAVLERINPRLAQIPNNHDRLPTTSGFPIRRRNEIVLRGFREILAEGPLAPWISEEIWASVGGDGHAGSVQPRRVYRATQGVVSYHLWLRRYGARVRGADPAEALGIARP